MAYDLVVGPGSEHGAAPDCAASIDFHDLPALARPRQRVGCDFLERISHLSCDQTFDPGQAGKALACLLPLLHASLHPRLHPDERSLLNKLVGVLSFADRTQQPVHGICD